jgi:alanine or glycine:cation symporter, AGCS family
MDFFLKIVGLLESFFWSYIGFILIVLAGLYFTLKSKGFQFRVLSEPRKTIEDLKGHQKGDHGTHPIKLYFASIGGSVGLGNIVGVITAVLSGGPGALFWLWIASLCGMLIKYSEIYLSVKHRVLNPSGGYDGGPIYYLKQAFGKSWIGALGGVSLCFYCVEVYQFVVVTDTLSFNLNLDRYVVIPFLLVLVVYVGLGGIDRLAKVTTTLMPVFLILYVSMAFWVLFDHLHVFPALLKQVFLSAFTGHAAAGGFVGATFIQAAQYGTARAVYSGDIGVGYDASIQAETSSKHPERQARLAIFSLFTNTFICTLSILLVLVTGVWKTTEPLLHSEYVAKALSLYFPYMNVFMTVLLFLAGYTTIIAFFTVGLKTARILWPKGGTILYCCYALFAYVFFSFYDQTRVMTLMQLSGGMLVLLNVAAIMKMRHEIKFI